MHNAFLEKGGEKGRQIEILTAGNYRINTGLFTVITSANAAEHGMSPRDLRVYKVEAGKIGIITTFDGSSPQGLIAAPPVQGHDGFQDGQAFIDAKGHRGLQEEVISAGACNLNPWFVQVEQVELTDIAVGTVWSRHF